MLFTEAETQLQMILSGMQKAAWDNINWEKLHSWRRRIPTLLYRAKVDEQRIMAITKHNSIGGVRQYKEANHEMRVETKDFLSSRGINI